jgi:tripartite-type tricarboxylate transporter receptor subunit TctC
MSGKALWKSKLGRIVQERKPAGRGQAAQRFLMTAGAILGAILLIAAMVGPLCAQTYPNKPIRLILPMAPGGPTDILGRIIELKLAERLGQPVVPENRPGAGSNVGTEVVAKARPDGYTIILVSPALAISPGLYKKLNYDPIKDLTPISLVSQAPLALVVRPSLPVKNLKEFVEYAKARPGKLNFGSGGIGAGTHLAGELLKSLAKIDIVHVPYKSAVLAMNAMMGGEIDMVVIGAPSAAPQIQAGKVKALAVLSGERVPSLPDVPTSKEAGIDNWEVVIWWGIFAPAGTPRDIINRLNAEWIKSAAMPDTIAKMRNAGFEPLSSTPGKLSEFMREEIPRWGQVIKEANIPTLD